MNWLPKIENFRQVFQTALSSGPSEKKLQTLAWLAGHDLGFLEVLQLDRALVDTASLKAEGFTNLRLALIGSATLQQLEPGIRVAGLRHKLRFELRTGGYGLYRQEVLLPTSFLHSFAPNIVLLSLSASDVLGNIPLTATEPEAEAALSSSISDLRHIWRSIRTSIKASVIQQTFVDRSLPIFGSFDRMAAAAPSRLVGRLNDLVAQAAKEDGVPLLDIAAQAQRDGIDVWFDVRRWLQAKQEIRPEAAAQYGELFARIVSAQQGRSRKCLVCDLDNTLWGGVIGDDGLEGIVLGSGTAKGEAHLMLQSYALQLKQRGIVLAVCSKNDPSIAERAFQEHPEMLLKRSDITSFVANWDDKAENLLKIASQLNIGVDSLVFIDDNPIERARIREALPMVAVPELPDDPAGYAVTLADAGYFEAVNFTQEDRERAELYARDAERSEALSVSTSIDDFLGGLGMSVVYGPFSELGRVTQLINKTNQFNTTTRRYTAEEVAAAANSADFITVQFRLIDRYGDNGIVSAILLAPTSQAGTLEIEAWVMSCRVFSRELEYEIMNAVVEAARQKAARTITAGYIRTPKNTIISDLYRKLGFSPANAGGNDDLGTRWRLDLSDYLPHQTHIRREIQ
jgi:FkbH-like protein